MFAGHVGVALAVGRVERRVNLGVFVAAADAQADPGAAAPVPAATAQPAAFRRKYVCRIQARVLVANSCQSRSGSSPKGRTSSS